MLEFKLLGPLQVLRDGRTLELGAMQQRAVLAILLINRPNPVPTDRLADELWGEQPPPTGLKAVQVYVSRLRKSVGTETLLTHGQGYMVSPEAAVDIDRFESLLATGRGALAAGNAELASDSFNEALALWRGPPLADFVYDDFAQTEIARLQELRLDALEDRAEAALALGHARELVGELQALAAEHPNRERLLSQLMLALYRSGRQQDALAAYQRGRRSLSELLGLEPTPYLRELEQRILDQDPTLDCAIERPGARRPPAATRSRRRGMIVAAVTLAACAALAAGVAELAAGSRNQAASPPNSLVAIGLRDDRVEGSAPVGADPDAVALGAGSIWVANLGDQTVSRVDPSTLRPIRTIPVGGAPDSIASAGGSIWVAESDATSNEIAVRRIDAEFDTIGATVELPDVVPGSEVSMTGRRSLWVAPFSGELAELDPTSGQVLRRLDPGVAPVAVGVGAGSVWVADNEADDVARVSPAGVAAQTPVGHGPSAIAVDEHAVWVADTGDDAVERLDPASGAVIATIPVGSAPAGIAVGAGSVWVADSGNGTVVRIDPSSDRVLARIAVGGSPRAITIGDGRAWVAIDAPALPPTRPRTGGTVRLDAPYDVTSMDPALADDPISWQLLYATCAKLLNYPDTSGPSGARLVPEVAASFPRRSDGGRTYTFEIRPGFRFSPPSNAPITAQTFKDTLERDLNPRMRSPIAGEFADIVGADAYMAGRAPRLAGVSASGNRLTLHLREPSPAILARLAEPAGCAVPSDTPVDPDGVDVVPSGGPYRVASRTADEGIELVRNPNYAGRRPHSLSQIEVSVGVTGERALAEVENGQADYALNGEVTRAAAGALDARYGPGSPAAKAGHQRYFVNSYPNLSFLALNSRRPLFAGPKMRRAVSYAINRAALAQLGEAETGLPETPIDHYLPPGMPGFRAVRAYPDTPDASEARRLAAGDHGATAILYTCEEAVCKGRARAIVSELSAIGLRVRVEQFPDSTLYTKIATPGARFDIATLEWEPSYVDPDALLNFFLESRQAIPSLDDGTVAARLATAARLTGPARYLAYGRLDAEIARAAAPLVAYGVASSHDFFSARIGCEHYGVFGYDVGALCIRREG